MNQRQSLILIICLLLTSLAAFGWLFYQNLQLQKQIAQTQSTLSSEPNSIKGDALLQSGTLKNVTLRIDFGDGKRYESLSDITYSEQKTPIGFLKANTPGIKREIGFSEFSVKELIKTDANNLLQSIDNYSNSEFLVWSCYINRKLCTSPLENIQSNDIVEWKYETKQ